MISHARAAAAYWLVVAALFIAQAAYTFGGLDRLWYEELAEGIRNPFWLDHRLVYDGISSNVGWYGLVLLVYKAFGFSPYAAKYVRLALHLPFLVCASLLLRQLTGASRAWLPLAAFALSPTALYFNSLATSYGIDLELFPVVLWLILRGRPLVAGCVTMIACLMFPSFLFYLPALIVLVLWLRGARPGGWMLLGFAMPLIAALLYLRNDGVFLVDPAVAGAGVFRGGGQALTGNPGDVRSAAAHVLQDLFFRGNTYYFALPQVEFSGLLGIAAAGGILVGSMMLWKWKPAREPLVLAGLLCVVSLVAPAFTRNLPGLRRSTGVICGVYVLVAAIWAMPLDDGSLTRVLVRGTRIACVLLLLHHIIVFPANYRYLVDTAAKMQDPWFSRFGTPDVSVRRWADDWVLAGKPLECAASPCRYSEIYAAVAGYLKWTRGVEPRVLARDPVSGQIIQLTPSSWETYTLNH